MMYDIIFSKSVVINSVYEMVLPVYRHKRRDYFTDYIIMKVFGIFYVIGWVLPKEVVHTSVTQYDCHSFGGYLL